MSRVLVVDDEPAVRAVVARFLRTLDMTVVQAGDGAEALEHLADCDLLITDVQMPGMSGLELLAAVRRRRPELPVVVMTGHATVPMAVEAMRSGALNFVTKPFEPAQLEQMIRAALRGKPTVLSAPPQPPTAARALEETIQGSSPATIALRQQVWRVAASDATVLITGESGTGKEVVARAIHAHGRRAAGPFVAFNCGGIPETLVEAELFGHARGAFTGAAQSRQGYLGQAEGGTLLLDEIGELPPPVQAKLLRVLQERAYTPLGTSRVVRADVRILAATHRDLEGMAAVGAFREDLFYRLNVLQVEVPPLRDRGEDVVALARVLLERAARAEGRAIVDMEDEVVVCLRRYRWPGNVRELGHTLTRAAVMTQDAIVRLGDLPARVRAAYSSGGAAPASPRAAEPTAPAGPPLAVCSPARDAGASQAPVSPVDLKAELARVERELVARALTAAGGNRQRAADLLGLRRTTLVEKLKRLGLAGAGDDE